MRRRSICHRSKPTFQPYRTVHQQGNRNPDRTAGNQSDPRQKAQRTWLSAPDLQPEADYIAIKMPVFSFEKIRGADISLGPEMKSTGECLGIAKTFNEALYKAFLGAGIKLPKHKNMIMTRERCGQRRRQSRSPEDSRRSDTVSMLHAAPQKYCNEAGVKCKIRVNKIEQESPNLLDLILGHKIDLVIDTPSQGVEHSRDGFLIRRTRHRDGC